MNKGTENYEEDFYRTELNFAKGDNFYIYGDVDESFPKNIIAPFIELVQIKTKEANPSPINIHLSSPGGYVQYCFDLVSWIEYAKLRKVIVNTYVTSVAYSAASVIAVVGSKRFVSRRAQLLIHFARGFDYSHNPEMTERNRQSSDFMQEEMIAIYNKYTKIKDVRKKMLADNFYILGGNELIKQGFADELF